MQTRQLQFTRFTIFNFSHGSARSQLLTSNHRALHNSLHPFCNCDAKVCSTSVFVFRYFWHFFHFLPRKMRLFLCQMYGFILPHFLYFRERQLLITSVNVMIWYAKKIVIFDSKLQICIRIDTCYRLMDSINVIWKSFIMSTDSSPLRIYVTLEMVLNLLIKAFL